MCYVISAFILMWRTCDIEGSILDPEYPNIEITEQLYPKGFSTCNVVLFEG